MSSLDKARRPHLRGKHKRPSVSSSRSGSDPGQVASYSPPPADHSATDDRLIVARRRPAVININTPLVIVSFVVAFSAWYLIYRDGKRRTAEVERSTAAALKQLIEVVRAHGQNS